MLIGIISVQGNIGAGKTRAMSILEDRLSEHKGVKIKYVTEPLDYWTTPQHIPESYLPHLRPAKDEEDRINGGDSTSFMYLDIYYSNPRRNSFLFQIHAFTTRLEIMNNAIRDEESRHSGPYIIISERDLISDKEVFAMMLLEDGLLPRECVPVYERIWNMMATPIAERTKAIVNLVVPPEICMERVRSRNRNEESKVSLRYLQRVDEFNRSMVERHRDSMNVSTIDWSSNLETHEQMSNDLLFKFRIILDEMIEKEKAIKTSIPN